MGRFTDELVLLILVLFIGVNYIYKSESKFLNIDMEYKLVNGVELKLNVKKVRLLKSKLVSYVPRLDNPNKCLILHGTELIFISNSCTEIDGMMD